MRYEELVKEELKKFSVDFLHRYEKLSPLKVVHVDRDHFAPVLDNARAWLEDMERQKK